MCPSENAWTGSCDWQLLWKGLVSGDVCIVCILVSQLRLSENNTVLQLIIEFCRRIIHTLCSKHGAMALKSLKSNSPIY